MLAAAAVEAPAVCVLNSAPKAMPVLNNTYRPNTAPARGINIARQRPKLFMKIDGISVPFALFVVTV